MSEEKEYYVKAPMSLYDCDNLKIRLQTKKALRNVGWDRLYGRALNNADQWFCFELMDNQTESIKTLGWKLKEYVAPLCSCGYCPECDKKHLEEMKTKLNERDEWILTQMAELQDQINELAKKFSKEGEAYWNEMHIVRGATG